MKVASDLSLHTAGLGYQQGYANQGSQKKNFELEQPVSTAQYNRQAQDIAQQRMTLMMKLFALVGVIFVVRLVTLGMEEGFVGGSAAKPAAKITPVVSAGAAGATVNTAPFARRDILDRNEQILATTLDVSVLGVEPAAIDNPDETAAAILSVVPDINEKRMMRALKSSAPYAVITNRLTPSQAYKLHALGNPALRLESKEERIYPQGRLAAHILGYVNVDGDGLAGIEHKLNKHLRIQSIQKLQQSSASGPLQLSLDMNVQHALADELRMAMNGHQAKAAVGIIMDVKTGEIIALASMPDFDPNVGRNADIYHKSNRATKAVYELGSTLKTFTFAAAFDHGLIDLADEFDATAPLQRGRFFIRDDHPKNRILTTPEVYIYSSNIGTAQIADRLGSDRQQAFLQSIGLFDRNQLEVLETARPIIPDVWRDTTRVTVSYGYGISLSPLHLVAATAAMVNGGTMVTPTVLKVDGPVAGQRVISEETSLMMRQLMRLNVLEGTGSRAAVPGYRVAGKTGTARKSMNGTYSHDHIIASFIATYPVDDPRYVVYVMVDEPQSDIKSGGIIAAPVIAQVIRRTAPLLGIAPAIEDKRPFETLKQYLKTEKK